YLLICSSFHCLRRGSCPDYRVSGTALSYGRHQYRKGPYARTLHKEDAALRALRRRYTDPPAASVPASPWMPAPRYYVDRCTSDNTSSCPPTGAWCSFPYGLSHHPHVSH